MKPYHGIDEGLIRFEPAGDTRFISDLESKGGYPPVAIVKEYWPKLLRAHTATDVARAVYFLHGLALGSAPLFDGTSEEYCFLRDIAMEVASDVWYCP